MRQKHAAIMDMNYSAVKALLDRHTLCKILRADRAAYIITFLDRAYVSADGKARKESDLVEILVDLACQINDQSGANLKIDPRRTLTEWSSERCGYLRRFTKADSVEYFYDITRQARRAVDLISSLTDRPFVGTQARLNIVMNLAREIVLQGDAEHAEEYLEDLKKQRDSLNERIEALENGKMAVLTPHEIYDRFYQFEEQARALLSDQREVEENFRILYRDIRRDVESDDGPKAILLDKFFEKTDLISSSEQGLSVAAFNRLLLSSRGRELMATMIDELYENATVKELDQDQRLRQLYPMLLDNSSEINGVLAGLDKQLNYYIGSRLYLEARAVSRTGHRITALTVQHPELMELKEPFFLEFELPSVQVSLPCDRPLYTKAEDIEFDDGQVDEGDENEVSAESLLDVHNLDINKLRGRLYIALSGKESITLKELVERYPPEFGAEEIFAYQELSKDEFKVKIDSGELESVSYSREDPKGARHYSVLTMDRTCISVKTGEDGEGPDEDELIGVIEQAPPRIKEQKEEADASSTAADKSEDDATDSDDGGAIA